MLSKNLKSARINKRFTQDDVANFLNVKRQTYSAYERNVSIPDAITLDNIAKFFGVTADYLLTGKEPTKFRDEPDGSTLNIPDDIKGIKFAFHGGEDDLTQEEINEVAEFVRFVRSKRNRPKENFSKEDL